MVVSDGLNDIKKGDKTERRPLLAADIEAATVALKKILASGLNRKAIVLLVSQSSGVGRGEVGRVIAALEDLHKTYCQ